MAANNPYNGRFRWWYPAIADWLIANPGGKQEECARDLNRHVNTISLIMNSDLFKAYYEERRKEWEARHDFKLRDKMHKIADLSLDIMFQQIETKRQSVPIKMLKEISESVLDRLGYTPQTGPQVQITNNNNTAVAVVAPVSVSRLEEARAVLRQAEQNRANSLPGDRALSAAPTILNLEKEAGSQLEDEGAMTPPDSFRDGGSSE